MLRRALWTIVVAVLAGLGGCCACPGDDVHRNPEPGRAPNRVVNSGPPHLCQPYWWNACDSLNARLEAINLPSNGGYYGWAVDVLPDQANVFSSLRDLLIELDRDVSDEVPDPVLLNQVGTFSIADPGDLVIEANAVRNGLKRDGLNTKDPNHHDPGYATPGWADPDNAVAGGNSDSYSKLRELQGRVRTALGTSVFHGR